MHKASHENTTHKRGQYGAIHANARQMRNARRALGSTDTAFHVCFFLFLESMPTN